MYKAGDKFIIEIGEEYESEFLKTNIEADKEQKESPVNLYRIRGFNSLVFDENGLKELTKYDETVVSDVKAKEYEKGLSDAWECAKKVYLDVDKGGLNIDELGSVFGKSNPSSLMQDLTPQEAINKLKAWEEKQEIKAGDVIVSPSGSEAIVHLIDSSGNLGCIDGKEQFFIENSRKKLWKRTGKHIDLTEIFKELEEEEK